MTDSKRDVRKLTGKRAVREEPFSKAIGEESDMSREQGGRLVEMPYKLDALRFILATNEVPSHTPLSAFGFRALSRLFMNGLVHSCIVLLNKNSNSHITFAGLLH